MDPDSRLVIPLTEVGPGLEKLVGGKAANLGRLKRAGFRVPDGFCLTIAAYEGFVEESSLSGRIRMELGRKPLDSMRWEEIWDAALRIRAAFLAAHLPEPLAAVIREAVGALMGGAVRPLVVRSSAPEEDSRRRSFAGLHESIIGVETMSSVLDAVRVVWSSLWSDAALMYRRELNLSPAASRMAVVIQELTTSDRSGVAFGRDPRSQGPVRSIVEAVPGRCDALVDGHIDPDRWFLDVNTGDVIEWRRGERGEPHGSGPLLDESDLRILAMALRKVEEIFSWAPDIEWTGRGDGLTLLQARPITTIPAGEQDERNWYLSLRPDDRRLRDLRERVADDLIPALEAEGLRFANEAIEAYDDARLASAIEERLGSLQRWRAVYRKEFIPFAHGVRRLGTYYNDAVRPEDPYEFVGLLRGQSLIASGRNALILDLARRTRDSARLREALRALSECRPVGERESGRTYLDRIQDLPGGLEFARDFEELRSRFMNVAYDDQRLEDRPDLIAASVLELADSSASFATRSGSARSEETDPERLERRLLDAVGPDRRDEALEIVAIGRLSWRLRDDDNILMGRLESQLLKAVRIAARRLRDANRLRGSRQPGEKEALAIAGGLRDPGLEPLIAAPTDDRSGESGVIPPGVTPRQLIGQPAAPGLASGRVRRIRKADDLRLFRAGEVLVCDAIQPTMTHLVPLAAAVVERRGGMLIHGAIVAREMGIPCVNGITRATDLLLDGAIVSVDGDLGIVTIGEPELDLESRG